MVKRTIANDFMACLALDVAARLLESQDSRVYRGWGEREL